MLVTDMSRVTEGVLCREGAFRHQSFCHPPGPPAGRPGEVDDLTRWPRPTARDSSPTVLEPCLVLGCSDTQHGARTCLRQAGPEASLPCWAQASGLLCQQVLLSFCFTHEQTFPRGYEKTK